MGLERILKFYEEHKEELGNTLDAKLAYLVFAGSIPEEFINFLIEMTPEEFDFVEKGIYKAKQLRQTKEKLTIIQIAQEKFVTQLVILSPIECFEWYENCFDKAKQLRKVINHGQN